MHSLIIISEGINLRMRRRIETFVFTFRQISLICALKESEINNFQDFTNTRRTTINFTLKLSSKQIIFLDTEVFKGPRFNKHILRPPKPTETFQNTHFSSFYPLSVKKGFAYGCLLYTSPSPRDLSTSRMPSSA